MGGIRGWAVLVAVGLLGCATTGNKQARADAAPLEKAASASVYEDSKLGFAVVRPSKEWQLEASEFFSEEGISIPLVLRHTESGSQVILQIAPDVASPIQYAERMTQGLRSQPGFETTEVEPIPLTDGSVGFFFRVGEDVLGRVAVREGGPGNVFMVMATWPNDASSAVVQNIDAIIVSIEPVGAQAVTARAKSTIEL